MTWLVFLAAAAITIAIYVSVPASTRASRAIAVFASRVSRRPLVAESLVFLIAFALSAIPSIIWSVPLPSEPDEFSYLLAADTFARGRLTNPPHPMADALEFADVIQRPTYASKHPPAQGAVLAFGQKLFDQPIVGVWIINAIGCAAVTWMMRAVAPARWSLLAGLLVAMHPLIAAWTNSYWGGSIAMLGGALTLGAVLRQPSVMNSLIAGVGLSILAISRPFEGAVFALLIGILSLRRLTSTSSVESHFRVCVVSAITVIPTLFFLAYYNARVTHNWKLFPHRLHQQQYMITPRFIWEQPRTDLQFKSPMMRDAAQLEFAEYKLHVGPVNWIRMMTRKSIHLVNEYLPSPLLVAVVLGLRVRDHRVRIAALLLLMLPAIHLAIVPITRVPYFAPLVGGIAITVIAGLRSLPRKIIAPAVAVLVTTQAALWVYSAPHVARRAHEPPAMLEAQQRSRLSKNPGKHLVLVRYTGSTVPLYDFVHNGADIDGARIVFARSLDAHRDQAMLAYFADRKPWMLRYDERTFELEELGDRHP